MLDSTMYILGWTFSVLCFLVLVYLVLAGLANHAYKLGYEDGWQLSQRHPGAGMDHFHHETFMMHRHWQELLERKGA